MNRAWAALLFTLGVFTAASALAETDYTCLKACIGNGDHFDVCTHKCSYDSSAKADRRNFPRLNYACLKDCTDNGGAVTSCVPQCTDASMEPGKNLSAGNSNHNIFNAPVEYSGVVLNPRAAAPPPADVDYACVKLCAHGGLQYELCSQHCSK